MSPTSGSLTCAKESSYLANMSYMAPVEYLLFCTPLPQAPNKATLSTEYLLGYLELDAYKPPCGIVGSPPNLTLLFSSRQRFRVLLHDCA